MNFIQFYQNRGGTKQTAKAPRSWRHLGCKGHESPESAEFMGRVRGFCPCGIGGIRVALKSRVTFVKKKTTAQTHTFMITASEPKAEASQA